MAFYNQNGTETVPLYGVVIGLPMAGLPCGTMKTGAGGACLYSIS